MSLLCAEHSWCTNRHLLSNDILFCILVIFFCIFSLEKVTKKPKAKPLFYADRGRYEPHVIRVMTRLGYRMVYHCENSEKQRGKSWNEEEALKKLTFIWLRNRAGFPWKMTEGGHYVWNHIPNEYLLTKKHYLAMNIREYVKEQGSKLVPRFRDIHPETFVLEHKEEIELFFEALKTSEKKREQSLAEGEKELDNETLWIIKPVDSSGGRGIGVVGTFKEFAKEYLSPQSRHLPRAVKRTNEGLEASSPDVDIDEYDISATGIPETSDEALNNPIAINLCHPLIAQRYIASPLLLNGHKFDIRAYMFIANLAPPMVFYHDGYLRVNIEPYDTDNLSNVWSHISNIGLQKAHPDYEEKKIETKWSFKTWTNHMLKVGLTDDPHWIDNVIRPQLSKIMEIAYRSVLEQFKVYGDHGCFALLGVDFLIDASHRAWLLEYTKTPAGHSTLEPDDTLFHDMMDEIMPLTMEIQSKLKGLDSIPDDLQLENLKNFVRIV